MIKQSSRYLHLVIVTLAFAGLAERVEGQYISKVLEPGEVLEDRRATEIRTYTTEAKFKPLDSLADWEIRKAEVRMRTLVGSGLWPMPERGPVEVEIFDRTEHEDYTLEKVLLKTTPGYYATGNLYRPRQKEGEQKKFPGILCPHGHWEEGRFTDSDTVSVPGRGLSFARQGYVCFMYDMVGYADNEKLIEHNFETKRDLLWGISPTHFQLWTGLRAFDFIASLPDVDPDRIGCTGASGGGTQTFFLYSVEDRIQVAAPVNMISATMAGGCKCESLVGLRLGLNNMDIGGMMAPRPQILICATGDWTKNTPTVEFPAIQSIYKLHGHADHVIYHQEDEGHNYNAASRQKVYDWFGKWFYPDRPQSDFVEKPFEIDDLDDIAVFADREIPEDCMKQEELFASIRKRMEARFNIAFEKIGSGPDSRKTFIDGYGEGYRTALGVSEPDPKDIHVEKVQGLKLEGYTLEKMLLTNEKTGQKVPANLWLPGPSEKNPVLLIHLHGKSGVVSESGYPGGEMTELLDAGHPVLAIDCFGTGESAALGEDRIDPLGGITRFATYNLTDAACRVQDILLAESYLAHRFSEAPEIVGMAGAGAWVLLAHGLADRSVGTNADLSGVDFSEDRVFIEDVYIPNLRRVGDFATSIVLGGSNRPVRWNGVKDDEVDRRLRETVEKATM